MTLPDVELVAPLLAGLLALLALVLAGLASVRLVRVQRRLAELEAQAQLSAEHYQGLSIVSAGQGERLAHLEQEIARLQTRLDELGATGGGAVFSQAIHMARKGCSAREIMETCGLSAIEADLMVLMHNGGRPV